MRSSALQADEAGSIPAQDAILKHIEAGVDRRFYEWATPDRRRKCVSIWSIGNVLDLPG